MRQTLSYIRGLRDVLEIPARQERREYILVNERNSLPKRYAFPVGAIIASTGCVILGEKADMPPWLNLGLVAVAGLAAIYSLTLPSTEDDRYRNLEMAGRAYQNNIRNGAPIPSGLEKDKF